MVRTGLDVRKYEFSYVRFFMDHARTAWNSRVQKCREGGMESEFKRRMGFGVWALQSAQDLEDF